MAAILIGLASSAMLAIGVIVPWPVGGFVNGVWDLAAIVGVIASVGLFESAGPPPDLPEDRD
jgi:hypothetical protein